MGFVRHATFRPRVGGLREETSQGRNSQGRDLAGASASAGARLLYYALLDAPTDLATSTVQRPRNLAATAIQTFAHNAIAATVQVDPHWQPGGRVHACRHGHRTEVRGQAPVETSSKISEASDAAAPTTEACRFVSGARDTSLRTSSARRL